MIPSDILETLKDACVQRKHDLCAAGYDENDELTKGFFARYDAALAWLAAHAQPQAAGGVVALDMPDGPGWWAFEGSEWGSKAIYLVDDVESGWKEEWDEAAEEHWNRYEENLYTPHRYEPMLEEPFQTIVKVEWVRAGMQISNRQQCGPYSGEPVLGFLSPKYRWSHIPHGIDTWCGKWYRVHLPWETSQRPQAQD